MENFFSDPIDQFKDWFDKAKGSEGLYHNAMTLATASRDGTPNARIVLLKGIDSGKFLFYTNYDSAKGSELVENPRATLVFFWQQMKLQVRINGSIEKTSRENSEKYFHSRPRGSQISASISDQSKEVSKWSELKSRHDQFVEEHREKKISCPENWGGFALSPERMEFWVNRDNRLHLRVSYERNGDQWEMKTLQP